MKHHYQMISFNASNLEIWLTEVATLYNYTIVAMTETEGYYTIIYDIGKTE